MSIEGDRQISRFVPDRLPEFVRVDHPTLVAFLEAYYEWLGLRRNSGVVVSPMAMHDIPDVDHTLDQFIEQFKKQYLFNFPETLAFNKDTGPVDPRRIIKNIKQFYLAKGTEKSYEFLFRIFYDTNVEFYYPKKDILRLSSGRWIQNNYLRISNDLGDQIYQSEGNLIVQKNERGEIVASARVISVNVIQLDTFPVAELLISNRNGTFQTGDLGIEFQDGEVTYKEVRVYSVVSSISIEEGGLNYRIGETVRFVSNTGDGGQRGSGIVAEVDALGGVRKISIDDFGINYTNPPTIEIDSSRGTGFRGTAIVGSLGQSFGYYANNDGRLSTNKVLQDNHYYQNWSYVLKSEIVIDTYRELIRRLVHPVGTGMFGSVLIKRCNRANLDNAAALMSFRIPYIGNYVPYTFQTFDDLSVWFQEVTVGGLTAAGYSPTAHDSLIQQEGNRFAVIGNPITNDVAFKEAASGILTTPGFPNADPFWIVYPHPNKQVAHGYHYARVWKPQVSDFVRWREWIQNHTTQPNYEEFLRFIGFLSRSEYDDLKASGEVAFLMEGGIAGSCPCPNVGSADCDGIIETCANSEGTVRYLTGVELFGNTDRDCCCCDVDGDDLPTSGPGGGPTIQGCKCLGGAFEVVDGQSICVCPFGTRRIPASGGCGWRCVRPTDGGGGGGGGGCEGCEGPCFQCIDDTWCQPICSPSNAGPCPCTNCSPSCPDSCCFDGSCPDPIEGCRPCLDPVYAAENFCECFPNSDECQGDICDIDPSWENCCQDDPCSPFCLGFCFDNPTHPRCLRKCIDYPCCDGCGGRECNPSCPQYDPCLTSCPNFDYCATGASACPEYGPCHPLCPDFDICTSVGCSGYDPCNILCNPDRCDGGSVCYDACVCDDPCVTGCSGFNWCNCDPGGATCCAENPCLPACNPDPCDFDGPCPDRCDPSCSGFDPCSTNCPGYGPCHPDCPEVPGDITRRPCNPLCPGFDRCNRDCPNYDRDFCCQGCNCGDGGGVGDPIYRDIDNDVRRWRRDNPPRIPADNNPCNNDIATCLFGQNRLDSNAHLGALLRYDENSEFRKITMRAFFNMPAGEAFDCREEKVAFVALPQFIMIQPVPGQQIKTEDPNRPLTVQYRIQNQENLGYYKVAQVNIYLDNRPRSTVSINTREVRLANIPDGRRTLKIEMLDFEGNIVAGTQTVVIFGYQYEGSSTFQTMQSSAVGDGIQVTSIDSRVRVLSTPNPLAPFDPVSTWNSTTCYLMLGAHQTELLSLLPLVYGCLNRLCIKPTECTPPTPFAFFCRLDLCNKLKNFYRCIQSNWQVNCSERIGRQLGGVFGGGELGIAGDEESPFGTLPESVPSREGAISAAAYAILGANFYRFLFRSQMCRISSCIDELFDLFHQKACQPLDTDCVNDQGNAQYNCIQELSITGKNPFCFAPGEDEEFNRNLFLTYYKCPNWRYEYPGWTPDRYWYDGRWITPTDGSGWYGGPEDRPADGQQLPDGIIDRQDRTKRPLTRRQWEDIWNNTPCGGCDGLMENCPEPDIIEIARTSTMQCITQGIFELIGNDSPRGGVSDEVLRNINRIIARCVRETLCPTIQSQTLCDKLISETEKCLRLQLERISQNRFDRTRPTYLELHSIIVQCLVRLIL